MKPPAIPSETKPKKFYHLINGIRGFALLNMLLFHFCYDIFIIFGLDSGWYRRPWVHVWQQFICISFLFISGISWHFGHNNVKKGLLLNLYGLLITTVTLIFMPSQAVWFGILNGIGCATLLLCVLDKAVTGLSAFLQNKMNLHPGKIISAIADVFGFLISLLLFALFRNVSEGYLGLGSISLVKIPEIFYRPRFMTIFGFPFPGFLSSDYFPILPWSFLLMGGYWFWRLAALYEKCLSFFCIKIPFFSAVGRRTIWIYLLHQPILYGIAYLMMKILGR